MPSETRDSVILCIRKRPAGWNLNPLEIAWSSRSKGAIEEVFGLKKTSKQCNFPASAVYTPKSESRSIQVKWRYFHFNKSVYPVNPQPVSTANLSPKLLWNQAWKHIWVQLREQQCRSVERTQGLLKLLILLLLKSWICHKCKTGAFLLGTLSAKQVIICLRQL